MYKAFLFYYILMRTGTKGWPPPSHSSSIHLTTPRKTSTTKTNGKGEGRGGQTDAAERTDCFYVKTPLCDPVESWKFL